MKLKIPYITGREWLFYSMNMLALSFICLLLNQTWIMILCFLGYGVFFNIWVEKQKACIKQETLRKITESRKKIDEFIN